MAAPHPDVATRQTVRALHLLLGRIHLHLAGTRPLTDTEADLAEDITDWCQQRNAGAVK